MRAFTIPAALLLATVFATGCSDQKAPTGLSNEFGPEFNQAPVVFTFSNSFTEFNPCTGLEHTLFVDVTVKEHVFQNGQNFHVNGTAQFDVGSSDGFSGSAVEHFAEHFANDGGTVTITDGTNVNLSNDSHQGIQLRFQFHLTISNGEVVRVEIFKFSSTCVGKTGA